MALFSGAHRAFGFALTALSLAACSQTPVTVTLHSLSQSGRVSFVCQADDGTGLKLDECPDLEAERRRMLALVTQTTTNEVAVVDLRDGEVVDLDPAVPGYTFARVNGTPGAIVSSPGGVASFVGVSGVRTNGLFALPTSCLIEPEDTPTDPIATQVTRDLTSWAACSLTSAPGEISLLVDPTLVTDPTTSTPTPRLACGSNQPQPTNAADRVNMGGGGNHACLADLQNEGGPTGRRKLLVALPEEHKLVLVDAQGLLDRAPGTFAACQIEATYPLDAQLPSAPVAPVLPDDLKISSADASSSACVPTIYPPSTATQPTPSGMAQSGNLLYVADSTLPVVHIIDVSDPCAPKEQDPLLPYSYTVPSRVVTTSRVAVSPLTPGGKQFVYAVDPGDTPQSVMVFDVSPNPGPDGPQRTPVIFPGSPRQPFSQPDRLKFSSNAIDVSFAMRDFPYPDPATGVGQFGDKCDPNPALANNTPGYLYRSVSDYTSGAIPFNLRGAFGFVMLENGQIPVIDVEDFDQPCRRPLYTNTSSIPDFRGCANDTLSGFLTYPIGNAAPTDTGVPTVTDESSCNIVEQNRPRSAYITRADSVVGLHAPSLRSFPQFTNPDPTTVLTATDQPHMLSVAFDQTNPAANKALYQAQVNLNGQLYADCPNGTDPNQPPPCSLTPQPLPVDPVGATTNTLTLPMIEPRSYVANDNPSLTYEGRVLPLPDRTSGFLNQVGDQWTIQDPDASFCTNGVEDSDTIKQEGTGLGIPSSALDAWSTAHADYVQITGNFLPDDDVYWSKGAGATCQNPVFGSSIGKDSCIAEFDGIEHWPALKDTRELTILQAYTDHLVVAPRNGNTLEDVKCCFPSGTAYTVRASHQWYMTSATAFHDIAVGPDAGRCVHTAVCDPRKKFFHARAFEVCNGSASSHATNADSCAPDAANVGCVHDFSTGAVTPGGDASQCIYEDLTSRFVVYRGASPSSRDMTFSWGVTGGFNPLSMSLTPFSTAVSPRSMVYVPELDYVAVIDGESLGLALFDLNSLGVVPPSPLY